jgi:hypothetical protein
VSKHFGVPLALLHDAIDQAVGQGLLRTEEVVAVEVQCHLLARLAAQLRVVGDLGTGRQARASRGMGGERVSRALSLVYTSLGRRASACDERRRSGLTTLVDGAVIGRGARVDAEVRTTRSRMPRIISASTFMSEAWPWMPPIEGWWIMQRECGKASRFPFAPPTSRRDPIEAARPTLIVETSALTCRMVSNIAKPAVTEPPGLLMYMYIGLLLSCGCHHGHASGCSATKHAEAGGELRTSESR